MTAASSPNDITETTPETVAHGAALDSVFFHLGKPASLVSIFGPDLDDELRKVRDFIARGVPCTKEHVLSNRAVLQFTSSDVWVKPKINFRYGEVMRALLESYIGAGLIDLNAPFTLQITGDTKANRMPMEWAIRKSLVDVVVTFIEMGADEKLVPYSSSFGGGRASDILTFTRSELPPKDSNPLESAIKHALMQRRIREFAVDECDSGADVAAAPVRRRKVL